MMVPPGHRCKASPPAEFPAAIAAFAPCRELPLGLTLQMALKDEAGDRNG